MTDGFDSIDVGPVKIDTGDPIIDIAAGAMFFILLLIGVKWLRR